MQHYLAITIGPIYKSIVQARATREIWAASFIFSLLMKELLKKLYEHPKVALILNPYVQLDDTTRYHGAGIYPDRCQILLKEKFAAAEIEELKSRLYADLLGGVPDELRAYFHIYIVQATYPSDTSLNIVHRLNQLLDNTELQQKFTQQGEILLMEWLKEKIPVLQQHGMDSHDSIFISYEGQHRLPSLIELCTQALRDQQYYHEKITKVISKNIIKENQRRKRDKSSIREEETILKDFKTKLPKDSFKMYHKYYAIVQSDGDGIGKVITGIGNDTEQLNQFSQKLMSFSQEAADIIANFGAIPVYIGGDDLLFVAPLINEAGESLFDCINKLDDIFKMEGASLSFGVAISYYKYPMGKVLETSYEQLFHAAKHLKIGENDKAIEKNALAFQVRKHSGQSFGTILPKGTNSYKHFVRMLEQYQQLDIAFLSSLIYHLKNRKYLLIDALATNKAVHFFEKNFNENTHKVNKAFVDEVKKLSEYIYQDMSELITLPAWNAYLPKEEQDFGNNTRVEQKQALTQQFRNNIIANTIYACLRLIHFLNAKDHE